MKKTWGLRWGKRGRYLTNGGPGVYDHPGFYDWQGTAKTARPFPTKAAAEKQRDAWVHWRTRAVVVELPASGKKAKP